ncbi:MAG: lactate utilization protein [Ruminococcus sp.]|jgi:L-lactate utilization protein LutB|nr:lactate utilization protein [Ruminococcus sp.]
MDKFAQNVILKRVNKVAEALKKNNMDYYYAGSKEEVNAIVENLLNRGDVIASGGSMTLNECGVLNMVKMNNNYKYFDRENVDPANIPQLYKASFSADVYLTSANAITENGELVNVDGNSNRIAAIAFGPKSVIVVAGYNKIVADVEEGIKRVKTFSAPANAMRLECSTPCASSGECCGIDGGICDGCASEDRICCNYLVSAYQRQKGRIKVIIVGEELGY